MIDEKSDEQFPAHRRQVVEPAPGEPSPKNFPPCGLRDSPRDDGVSQVQNLIRPSYSRQDIEQLFDFLRDRGTFIFEPLSNGLFPAAAVQSQRDQTGYSNVWVRDNIHVAHAHSVTGDIDVATRNILTLMKYFKKHRDRFVQIVDGAKDPQDAMNRPHIRFDGECLEEIDQQWAHAQNDALGYFLWLYSKLALEDAVKPTPGDTEMLAAFARFFRKIRFWEDEDSGHWEEIRKIQASSIGVVVAALSKLKDMIVARSLVESLSFRGVTVTIDEIDDLIGHGQAKLREILPAECIQSDPSKERKYDAALLFLIYPLQILEVPVADRILRDVIENLRGDHGVRRYLGDSYWAPDYKKMLPATKRTSDFSEDISTRDSLLCEQGHEAQWCIFDPIISVIYGKRFHGTGKREYLDLQIEYFNRSLGQITWRDGPIPPFRCPELYYIEDGVYVPNDHVPLLWTQANLMIAFDAIRHSLDRSASQSFGKYIP